MDKIAIGDLEVFCRVGGIAELFGVHALACPEASGTLKGGHQTH